MYLHMQPFPTRMHSEKPIFKFFPVLFILLFSPLLNCSPKRLHWSQGKHWEGKAPLPSQRQCSVKQDSWTQALGRARSISHWYFCAFTQNSAALSALCTQGPRGPETQCRLALRVKAAQLWILALYDPRGWMQVQMRFHSLFFFSPKAKGIRFLLMDPAR